MSGRRSNWTFSTSVRASPPRTEYQSRSVGLKNASLVRISNMPKKPTKLRPDVAEIAYRTMLEATGQAPKTLPPGEGEKNPEAVGRGRKGGLKGGKARASTLSEEERKEASRLAAKARWKKS